MLSTDPGKTKNVVFGYRPQAKDNDKLIDKNFLNDMMKSLGYASSLFEKRQDELFPKSLAEMRVRFMLLFRGLKSKSRNKIRHNFNNRNRKRLFLSNRFKVNLR